MKALAVLLALVPLTVHGGAGFPPERLLLSTDMSVDSGIGTLAAHALLHAAGDGSAQSVQAVPASLWANGANLTALAVRPGSGGSLEHWFAFDVAMAIADGQTLAPGRPFRCLDADCAAIELLPLPDIGEGAMVSALAFDGDGGALLLALDVDSTVGAVSYSGGAVLRCSAVACDIAADPATLPVGARVDSLEVLADGRWLLGFDSAGSIAGIDFADEDVLLHDPVGGSWGVALRLRDAGAFWEAADLDALAAPPALPDALFKDGFEAPAP